MNMLLGSQVYTCHCKLNIFLRLQQLNGAHASEY